MITPEDISKPKPDPESIDIILNTLNVSKEQALVVGDTIVDVKTAKNAQTDVAIVTYGYGNLQQMLEFHPDYCYDSILDLQEIL